MMVFRRYLLSLLSNSIAFGHFPLSLFLATNHIIRSTLFLIIWLRPMEEICWCLIAFHIARASIFASCCMDENQFASKIAASFMDHLIASFPKVHDVRLKPKVIDHGSQSLHSLQNTENSLTMSIVSNIVRKIQRSHNKLLKNARVCL